MRYPTFVRHAKTAQILDNLNFSFIGMGQFIHSYETRHDRILKC